MKINFSKFIGNESTKVALSTAFEQNRLPQVIILQGEVGLGKKTLASMIANIAVCTDDNKPCGSCSGCIKARVGTHPDIRVEKGSGVSGSISVDAVRSIIQDVYKKPEMADLNIYMLFIKSTLSASSQNKLLKIIEEPPGRALFIITINSAVSLLPTVRSRAQCFTLFPPSLEESASFCAEKLDVTIDESMKLAKLYGGNIGAMLQGEAMPMEIASNTSQIFDKSDEDAFLALTFPLIKQRDNFGVYLENLRMIFRDALILSQGADTTLGINPEQSLRISRKYRKSILVELVEICTEYINLSKRNLNMNLIVTSFCAKLRDAVIK